AAQAFEQRGVGGLGGHAPSFPDGDSGGQRGRSGGAVSNSFASAPIYTVGGPCIEERAAPVCVPFSTNRPERSTSGDERAARSPSRSGPGSPGAGKRRNRHVGAPSRVLVQPLRTFPLPRSVRRTRLASCHLPLTNGDAPRRRRARLVLRARRPVRA